MKPSRAMQSLAVVVIFAGTVLGAPFASAQRGARTMAAPRRTSVAASPSRPQSLRNPNFNSFSGFNLPGGSQVLAPGFTSNFPLLGSGQDLGIQAAINPATQLRLAFAQRFLRARRLVGTGGFYLLDGGGYYPVPDESPAPEQQQPPVVLLQQPPAQQEPAASSPDSAAAPLPDVGEFTLVLRGGQQIPAVAFTRSSDKIIYIDKDGGRHTLAVADLDTAATASINEERGTPLQLPL